MVTTGTFLAQFYGVAGYAQAIYTNQTSTVIERKRITSTIDVPNEAFIINDLAYEWDDKEYKWNVKRDLKAREPFFASGFHYEADQEKIRRALLEGLQAQKVIMEELDESDKATQFAHQAGINSIMSLASGLDYSSLKSMAEHLFEDKSGSGVAISDMFADLLGSAGTTAAALVIKDLILDKKFPSETKAAKVLTTIPYHIRF